MGTNPNLPEPSFSEVAAKVYFDDVRRYILRKLHDQQDAEDLVQEVFLRLATGEYSEQDVHNPRGLLQCIADRVIVDHLRKNGKKLLSVAAAGEAELDIPSRRLPDRLEDDLSVRQEVNQLEQACRGLPPRQYDVWALFNLWGLKRKQIARALGLTPESVKKYLTKANRYIRDRMRRLGDSQ
jgi:RNA polymerase sigma-70 factor (ECF subfamily)